MFTEELMVVAELDVSDLTVELSSKVSWNDKSRLEENSISKGQKVSVELEQVELTVELSSNVS